MSIGGRREIVGGGKEMVGEGMEKVGGGRESVVGVGDMKRDSRWKRLVGQAKAESRSDFRFG